MAGPCGSRKRHGAAPGAVSRLSDRLSPIPTASSPAMAVSTPTAKTGRLVRRPPPAAGLAAAVLIECRILGARPTWLEGSRSIRSCAARNADLVTSLAVLAELEGRHIHLIRVATGTTTRFFGKADL